MASATGGGGGGGDIVVGPSPTYEVVLVPTEATWFQARDGCAARGLVLATVNSAADQQALETALNAKTGAAFAWIGASDQSVEGSWVWIDGSPVTWSDWDVGQPGGSSLREDCVLLWSGLGWRWDDRACGQTADSYVCMPGSPPTPPVPPSPPSAPPSPPLSPPPPLPPGRSTTYVLSGNLPAPDPGVVVWSVAKATCEARGMELAAVRSQADWDALDAQITNSGVSTHFLWLGGSRSSAAAPFEWLDGSPFMLGEWVAEGNTAGDCLALTKSGNGGPWRFLGGDCTGWTNTFACGTTGWDLALPPPSPAPPPAPPLSPGAGGGGDGGGEDSTVLIVAATVGGVAAIAAIAAAVIAMRRLKTPAAPTRTVSTTASADAPGAARGADGVEISGVEISSV